MEILESGMVVPNEETPKHGIWISNLDLLVARSHTPTVYFYRPNGDTDFFSVETLRTALSMVLVPFYPLAGRLGVDRDGRVEVNCTGEGVLFVVARSESTVDDFGDFAPSPETRRLLVPSVDSGNPPCVLAMFQVTFFKCGGVCLGAAVHHTVADGLGALDFINAWSNLARGIEVSTPPFLDRSILRARSPPTVLFEHIEYARKPQTKPFTGPQPFDSTILKLSKSQLNSLKNTSNNKKSLSTFKAVVAYVWQCACKARSLTLDQVSRLYMTADARSRLNPRLPQGFLGNAIFRTSAVGTVGEIMSNSLEFGADRIHAATVRLNDDYVRSLVDYLELEEDVRSLAKGSWVLPSTDLWVISWQGLPIYEADFGWGKPIYMGRACLQFSGLVYVMHNPENDGGLSLAVALEPEHMPSFKEIFYQDLDCVGSFGV